MLTLYINCGDHVQGYKQKKAFIIAEDPMESTARNMWKVIHDRKCGAIVMLSNLMENGQVSVIIVTNDPIFKICCGRKCW